MQINQRKTAFGAGEIIVGTGTLAKQANGSVTLTYGGTVVLVTACMAEKPKEGQGFFPLTVEYQEKTYAAGRIPGGFFKPHKRFEDLPVAWQNLSSMMRFGVNNVLACWIS